MVLALTANNHGACRWRCGGWLSYTAWQGLWASDLLFGVELLVQELGCQLHPYICWMLQPEQVLEHFPFFVPVLISGFDCPSYIPWEGLVKTPAYWTHLPCVHPLHTLLWSRSWTFCLALKQHFCLSLDVPQAPTCNGESLWRVWDLYKSCPCRCCIEFPSKPGFWDVHSYRLPLFSNIDKGSICEAIRGVS